MGNETEGILATKLDILISDFREFKEDQRETNKDLRQHAVAEDKVQAQIATTVKWHTVIGAFAIFTMIGFASYFQLELAGTTKVINKIYNEGDYYRENRGTTIEIIELYKQKDLCSEQRIYRKET